MWELLLSNGTVIAEDECLWPDLPGGIVIEKFSYTDQTGVKGSLSEFDQYGFQRFVVNLPGGKNCGFGAQLIGIHDGMATIIEINETNGIKTKTEISCDKLTYSESLLRNGVLQ